MAESPSPSVSPSRSPSASPSVSPSRSPSVSPSRSPSASPSASPSPVAAGEVSYTIHNRVRIGKKTLSFVQASFGDGVYDKYPLYGIPLTPGQMGMKATVDAVVILESNGDALLYEWDRSRDTIRIFTEARAELTANVTTLAATVLELMVVGW